MNGTLTMCDLPFIEQIADVAHPFAELLARCGGFGEDGSRQRWALAYLAVRTTDEDTIRQIAAACDNGDHENNDILCALGRNPVTPPDVVAQLAGNQYVMVSERAASRPDLPLADMERLAEAGPCGARCGISMNPVTFPDLLVLLASDTDRVVRARVALHPSTPSVVLARLAEDRDEIVRGHALARLGGGA